MNTVKKLSGMALATAAAAAFTAAAVSPTAIAGTHKEGMGKCMGVNACKGHSSCKTASSSCKGHNSCKGKGWVGMSKDQCEQVGGAEAVFKLFDHGG